MALRDRLYGIGRNLAGAAAEAVLDWSSQSSGEPEIVKTQMPEDLVKAASQGVSAAPTDEQLADPKSMMWDPFAVIEQLGYRERPSSITYGTLRAIVYKMPIIQAIIQARVDQVASFAKAQHDRYDMGFRLVMRDREEKASTADKREFRDLEELLMSTGISSGDTPRHQRENFEQFLRKITWDSLVYDQLCFETVPNKKGLPAQWYAIDSASIRLADTASAYLKQKVSSDTKYVQIYDGMVITEYTQDELCFGVRNIRSDMRLFGYGTSELEMLMGTITSLLWAWQWNQKVFSQGVSAKGVLNFKGVIPERQLAGFRRHWFSLLQGIENAHKMPVTNAGDGLEWIKLGETNKDQEYSDWMDFLIKVCCAMYRMDPIELNFKYGNVGQRGALAESSNKEKITESKERGLRPLLRFIATQINRQIIWPINDRYAFEFVGLDASTHDDIAKLNAQRVKTTRTIDELRAEDNLPPLKDGMGDLILDPTYLQFYQQKQGAAMGEEGGGPPGAEAFGEEQDKDAENDDEESDFDFNDFFPDDDEEEEEQKKSMHPDDRPIVIDLEL